jgi:hypothetical protein
MPDSHRRRHEPRRARIAVQVDVIPVEFPGFLGADAGREAEHYVGVQPGLLSRFEQHEGLRQGE